MLNGKHLIAGSWIGGDNTFASQPAHGSAQNFAVGSVDLVGRACDSAEEAFCDYGYSSVETRAAFLNRIADEIDVLGDEITLIGSQETGLPEARLIGERGRTTSQLRLFATHILKGDYLDRRHDAAIAERMPVPRYDLQLVQRPIGPVAVFGASNFPLAFSTAGGDTASALAAGCPVIVKGHRAHPGTGELVAQAIDQAIKALKLHPGVFSMIHGESRDVGTALVQHPLIKAVGFTGSLEGGRALFNLCAAREEPIPFFGELGSVNPMFLLPHALSSRAKAIGEGWAGSLTMGAGQFCTNPGIVVVQAGADADLFISTALNALEQVGAQTMLTESIAADYRDGRDRIRAETNVQEIFTASCDLRKATPNLFRVPAHKWLSTEALAEEVFGPLGLIIEVGSAEQMMEVANSLKGQLTCTLHMDEADTEQARKLMPVLERKAGRVLVNGFPTGVEVCDAMVHGGPYPASTNFGATSVGTLSIRRFLRPVCYQNVPASLLPQDLIQGASVVSNTNYRRNT